MIKKYSVLVLAALLFSLTGMAQTDIPQKKDLKIDAANKIDDNAKPDQGTSLKIPSVVDDQPQVDFDIAKRNPVKMIDDRELVQAGAGMKIDPKVGPRQPKEGSKQHFADMYLGDVKNNGKFVGIVCRDHEFVDGDRVKIYVNGDVADPNILLTGSFKGVNVDLKEGFNRIDFEALNVGSSPPNTAQINVYDDKGELIYANKWLLSEGSKATLIVTKEAED
ncbi:MULTISPECIES: hypothetical protein [unclassified Zobellia]|uniref:hypothetical protein n=1 Tax=unclassified Zobellia TaxID=2620635 RepID=UPI001C07B912|nr:MULTISPECIES: hypothetical protein [unclassified Zobellia]MBU2975326.1 hypothetical protein [Zobellia sp. B3R18]MDO6817758.1 hypothetical protein [Zobellia sp. 1_MG-2023]